VGRQRIGALAGVPKGQIPWIYADPVAATLIQGKDIICKQSAHPVQKRSLQPSLVHIRVGRCLLQSWHFEVICTHHKTKPRNKLSTWVHMA
jgi:hypothetical protein